MCVCVYIYIYTYIYACVCARAHRHACKNVRVYPFTLVQIYMASFSRRIEFSSTSLWVTQIPNRREMDLKTRELQCSACFWPVEDSNGRLGVSHYPSDSILFGLASSLGLRKYSWPCHTEVQSKWTTTPRHFTTPSTNVSQLRCILRPKTKQCTVPTTRAIIYSDCQCFFLCVWS